MTDGVLNTLQCVAVSPPPFPALGGQALWLVEALPDASTLYFYWTLKNVLSNTSKCCLHNFTIITEIDRIENYTIRNARL